MSQTSLTGAQHAGGQAGAPVVVVRRDTPHQAGDASLPRSLPSFAGGLANIGAVHPSSCGREAGSGSSKNTRAAQQTGAGVARMCMEVSTHQNAAETHPPRTSEQSATGPHGADGRRAHPGRRAGAAAARCRGGEEAQGKAVSARKQGGERGTAGVAADQLGPLGRPPRRSAGGARTPLSAGSVHRLDRHRWERTFAFPSRPEPADSEEASG